MVIVVVASVIDLRTHKIPNLLTFPAALLGLIMQVVLNSWPGAVASLEGWFTALLVMIAIKMGRIGGGDVKLMAAAGAFLGPVLILLSCLYYCLCFGAVSIFLIGRAVPWNKVIVPLITTGTLGQMTPEEAQKIKETGKKKIPIGPAIAAGCFLAIWLQKPTLDLFGIR